MAKGKKLKLEPNARCILFVRNFPVAIHNRIKKMAIDDDKSQAQWIADLVRAEARRREWA